MAVAHVHQLLPGMAPALVVAREALSLLAPQPVGDTSITTNLVVPVLALQEYEAGGIDSDAVDIYYEGLEAEPAASGIRFFGHCHYSVGLAAVASEQLHCLGIDLTAGYSRT